MKYFITFGALFLVPFSVKISNQEFFHWKFNASRSYFINFQLGARYEYHEEIKDFRKALVYYVNILYTDSVHKNFFSEHQKNLLKQSGFGLMAAATFVIENNQSIQNRDPAAVENVVFAIFYIRKLNEFVQLIENSFLKVTWK